MHHVSSLRLILVLAGALPLVCSAQLTFEASLDSKLYGSLSQPEVGDPDATFMCGPVSTVNSLTFLQNKYSKIYGTNLIVGSPKDTALKLKDLMGTTEKGTEFTSLINGKKTWFKDHPGTVDTIIDARAIEATTKDLLLTWQWLFEQVQHGEDIELLVSQDLAGGSHLDHYVTLTEFKWTDTNGDGKIDAAEGGTLGFVDAADGKWKSTKMFEADGRIRLNDFKLDDDSNGAVYIWGAIKESPSPIPEPAAFGVMGVVCLGLLSWYRKKK